MTTRFPCLKIEGGLLSGDLIDQIADGTATGQKPENFGIKGSLTDEISSAWHAAREHWSAFQRRLERLPEDAPATTETRNQWVIPLLGLLGYNLVYNQQPYQVDGRTYHISHRAGENLDAPPVHIVGFRQSLDHRPETGFPRVAPHSLMQEFLNHTDHVWGIVTNGRILRVLRDSNLIRRLAYLEFDLERMMSGEHYADFVLLYRLLHRTRLPEGTEDAPECLLERYWRETVEQGGRVRDRLRDGVEKALQYLANGFLRHPANGDLREKVRSGKLSPSNFYQQLLRLVYRLLFLMVAEERRLLSDNTIYLQHYSLTRLRRLAETRAAYNEFTDLWESVKVLFRLLQDGEAGALLDLPPLNGDLFSRSGTPDLNDLTITNRDLFSRSGTPDLNDLTITNRDFLTALWHLSMYREDERTPWRRINYAALDVEELGSVYESLLDYAPTFDLNGPFPTFNLQPAGTERKSTGSYYTPPELVQELVRSALEPVIKERLGKAKTTKEKEQALLSITVCDPACGSGHFLLAAARRLGQELARLRSGEDEPSPEHVREAVREVITHCLYGVDKNPLAVDLCKVALWIEGHNKGKPLTFLDHRIRCGDSLVGVLDLKVLEEGIPDEAFDPVADDDKAFARDLKKRNANEREQIAQLTIPFDAHEELLTHADAHRSLTEIPDETPEQVRQKAETFERLRGGDTDWWHNQTACHLWTAAFFAELKDKDKNQDKDKSQIPTTGILRRYLESRSADGRVIGYAGDLAQHHRFFHWQLEFPEVFANGGFDVVLCNPPWERIKLQEQEFFATRDPEIARAPNKAARERLIKQLPERNPDLWKEYQRALHDAEALSKFLRRSGRFPLTARGDINTYAVFAELFTQIVKPDGRVGIVVPTGIATDDTNKTFFAHLVESGRLVSLYDFENREALFPGVHRSYKFCLLTLSGKRTERAEFAFFLTRAEQLKDERRRFVLAPEDLALLNPNTRTCPVFRTRADAELTRKIYERIPVLVNEQTGENPWGIRFMTMFHMANDSHLFRTRAELEREGFKLQGNIFVKGDKRYLPLYEAKMIWQFDHRFGTYEGVRDRSSTHLPTPTPAQYADPNFVAKPWYWVHETEVLCRISALPPVLFEAIRTGSPQVIAIAVASLLFACWIYADALVDQGVNSADEVNVTAVASGLLYDWIDFAHYHTFALHVSPVSIGVCSDDPFSTAIEPVDKSYLPAVPLAELPSYKLPQRTLAWYPADLRKLRAFLKLPEQYPALFLLAQLHPPAMKALRAAGLPAPEPVPPISTFEQAVAFAKQLLHQAAPKWLIGFRDVTNATNERTAIFSLLPRVGVGHKIPLVFLNNAPGTQRVACFLANANSLVLDYVARQKIGGMSLSYFILKQLPVLPPSAYTPADTEFIVPRVLELVYTAWDIKAFADDVWRDADERLKEAIRHQWEENRAETGGHEWAPPAWVEIDDDGIPLPPFKWDEDRRARLRAQLDAYYARLYGLTEEELLYILDPANIYGDDFPSETFRVLKEKEMRQFGEYRTQRLIMDAWRSLP